MEEISNQTQGIMLILFAVVYMLFTAFIIGHGLHFTNSAIALGLVAMGIYVYVQE